jgi:cell division protease FtsH
LIYGDDAVTTGASNDIERATEIAHKMVKQWGMSDALGPLAYGEDDGEGSCSGTKRPTIACPAS